MVGSPVVVVVVGEGCGAAGAAVVPDDEAGGVADDNGAAAIGEDTLVEFAPVEEPAALAAARAPAAPTDAGGEATLAAGTDDRSDRGPGASVSSAAALGPADAGVPDVSTPIEAEGAETLDRSTRATGTSGFVTAACDEGEAAGIEADAA